MLKILKQASAICAGALVLVVSLATIATAQSAATLTGKVIRAGGDPMVGAIVTIDETKREARTGVDGAYRFENIAAGTYHLVVRAEGYTSLRAEVKVGAQGATQDLVVEVDAHYAEVISVSPTPRAQFESYQPTSVLAGQDLAKQLEATLGATLQSSPGVAMRSLGPGPARPVIRGMDGDRVAVLQDGQRMGDLSSQSSDHGVTINPSSAEKIEVVRGPATLLYGANAIGGLVNVITDQIPTRKTTKVSGDANVDFGTNGGEANGSADVHAGNGTFAFHFGGGGGRSGDFSTPDGEVDNSQSRNEFVSLGGSWTGNRSYAGASYGYDDSKYGVPIVEEGETQLTPKRHAVTLRAGANGLDGAVSSYRATLGIKRYEHNELDGEEIATTFHNNTTEGELLVSHKPYGKLSGTIGGWFSTRAFDATGEEALSPPVDQKGSAFFMYEEVGWSHVTLQFGGRYDHTGYAPEGGLESRSFNEFSGSVGALIRPVHGNENFVIAASLARAARNPALEELYFFGPHAGNFAFEIGNPTLDSEHALGFDLSVRGRTQRMRVELTVFRNSIDGFIFRAPVSNTEFEARSGEFEQRFNLDETPGDPEFPAIEFTAANALMWGVEGHADIDITSGIIGEVTFDSVRGDLRDTGEPLPRIPPYRGIFGLRYQKNALQFGGSVTAVAKQDRVFEEETPTDGYGLLKLFASYSFQGGGVLNTITARLDNATNELYRNHLNYLKDVLPERGRTFKVLYNVSF
jgi:iron complex outermembrane recepter protein